MSSNYSPQIVYDENKKYVIHLILHECMIHFHVEEINFLVNLVFLRCESEVTRCGLCDFAIACVVEYMYVSTVVEFEQGGHSIQLKS